MNVLYLFIVFGFVLYPKTVSLENKGMKPRNMPKSIYYTFTDIQDPRENFSQCKSNMTCPGGKHRLRWDRIRIEILRGSEVSEDRLLPG